MYDRLNPGYRLNAGHSLWSSNGQFRLRMQGDGNLVLYTAYSNIVLWATGTGGSRADRAHMQGDGNFVLYRNNTPVWYTGTGGNTDSWLLLQNDGNVVIYDKNGRYTWASHTVQTKEYAFTVRDCVYSWSSRYARTINHLDIRIRLVPQFQISSEQLRILKRRWQQGIVEKWSNKYPCATANMSIGVQWVSSNEHHAVKVFEGPRRSNMLEWDTHDSGDTVAHEVGHMLGLADEYEDHNCPNRYPVLTGTVMDVISGPVAHRHITAICGRESSFDSASRGYSAYAGAFEMKTAEKIIPCPETDTKIKLSLSVCAGRLGQRLEYVVDLDESVDEISMMLIDDLADKDELKKGQPSDELMRKVRAILQQGKLIAPSAPVDVIVPGSIVGRFSIEIGEDQYDIRFPMSEDFKESGFIPPESDFIQTPEGEGIEELIQLIVAESWNLPDAELEE